MQILSLDSETHLFRPGLMCPPIVCLTWAEGNRAGILVGHDRREAIPEMVEAALDGVIAGETLIVGSYVAWDMSVFMAYYPHLTKKIFAAYQARGILCTSVVEKLLDIFEGALSPDHKKYNLEPLARSYLGVDLDKSNWRLRFNELDHTPLSQWPSGAVHYAVTDAVSSLRVFEKQMERANALGYTLPDAPEQSAFDFALRLASCRGVMTDIDHIREVDERTTKRMGELKIELTKAGLYSVRTPQRGKFAGIEQGKKSQKRMAELVTIASRGAPWLTATGRVSLDADTLERLSGVLPEIDAWLEFVGLEKSASTYIEGLYAGVTYPIHARFNVLVSTGRTSSSGPNLHNVPRAPGIRECYRARPGFVFVAVDYSTQEMRTWAQCCQTLLGFSVLASKYRENPDYDPHTGFAASAFLKISEEEALARLKAKDKEVKEARQRSKAANFGFFGGLGAPKFVVYARAYGVRIDEAEAKVIRDGWISMWSEARPYFNFVSGLAGLENHQARIVQVGSGRQRGGVGYTDGCNGYVQGLASDCSKAALFEVTRRCYSVETSALYGCRPVIMIHDEIVMEAPESYAHEAAMELKDVMEQEQNKYTPDVPARADPSMMYFWSKEAGAKYEGGRLVPCDAPTVAGAA